MGRLFGDVGMSACLVGESHQECDRFGDKDYVQDKSNAKYVLFFVSLLPSASRRWGRCSGVLVACFASVFLLLPWPVEAQNMEMVRTEQVTGVDTGWQVVCRPQAQNRTRLRCSMFYELGTANDRGRVVSIEIIREAKAGTLVIGLPLGVSLKDGVEITVGAEKLKVAFTNCSGVSCFGRLELTPKMVDAFRVAKTMSVEFVDGKGSKIRPEINMAGFPEALARSE